MSRPHSLPHNLSHDIGDSERNRLLRALPRKEFESLRPDLERVELAPEQVLYEPNEYAPYVYFPEAAAVSLGTVMADGTAVEAALVGRDGVVGLPLFIGARTAASRALVQIPGVARRIEAGALQAALRHALWLRALLRRYKVALLDLTAQSAACNALHSAEQRCARWLLMAHDRVGADEFPLTQKALSRMLARREAIVSRAVGALERVGLIRHHRGSVAVLDRTGLEAAACECYHAGRASFDRTLGDQEADDAAAASSG
jgi:CRP-like cAMP-binding protein